MGKISVEIIERWLRDKDWVIRQAAMNACTSRTDIPLEIIERWLRDENQVVRQTAIRVCNSLGIKLPLIRTMEPPEMVYKKCLYDVIVVAKIPEDAQVRGDFGLKCRSDKAIIIDIIGDTYGEKLGISAYNSNMVYMIGDEIEIPDFDYSNEECSTGFHFFCTLDEAKSY